MALAPHVPDPGIDLDWLAGKIDYRRFQDCVHCGLCTASCPTYIETSDENDSPRGRIYLMRAVTDRRLAVGPEVRKHLDLCLDCRACETACPETTGSFASTAAGASPPFPRVSSTAS